MAYHQCFFTWILQRWTEVVLFLTSSSSSSSSSNTKETIASAPHDDIPDLPSDMIVDILSRLPAECVLKCRQVCKSWSVLTSSPHFAQLHLKRAVPTIVMKLRTRYDDLNMCLTDRHGLHVFDGFKFNKARTRSLAMIGGDDTTLYGSGNGFLVMKIDLRCGYFVCNLVTRECITVERPPIEEQQQPPRVEGASAWICCGILFHSGIGEHILIFWQEITRGREFRYTIYMLSSRLWSNKAPTFSYRPRDIINPVVFNERLHWLSESSFPCRSSIISCDANVEGFVSMSHPAGRECRSSESVMFLGEHQGKLTFGHYQDPIVAIWMLDDYDTWSWSVKYNVNLLSDVKCGPRRRNSAGWVEFWRIFDGELVFNWVRIGMIGYHLDRKITRRLNIPLGFGCNVFPYTKCFVSLSSKTTAS